MKWMKLPLLVLFILTSFSIPTHSNADNHLQRVLIMFHNDIHEDVITSHDGYIIEKLETFHAVTAHLPTDTLHTLSKHPAIKHIEQDQLISVQAHWTDWGTEKIEAPRAWQQGLTGKGVKVAVIDTGIAPHPDLEIAKGVSFVSYTDSYTDDHGHGTHVAGTIAAGNNPNGLRGIAPDVELYAIKVLDHEGQGYHSTVIKAIDWAIQQNVDIINLSVGGKESSSILEKAINKAYNDHGILLVASSGNGGNQLARGNTVDYPAAYESVIAVAATDRFDQRAHFSGHGSQVELSAPGVRIRSTYLDGRYETIDGTSMAAPHVTAMLALLKEAQPSLTNAELRLLIRNYTKDLGTLGRDQLYGFGRIELPKEIQRELTPPEPPTKLTVEKIDDTHVTINWQHPTATRFIIYRNGQIIAEVENHFFFTDQLIEGSYKYEVTAINEKNIESAKSSAVAVSILLEKDYSQVANRYIDVSIDDWFISSLYYLQQSTIISGYPDGSFQPNRIVTRAEMATMLGRTLKLNGAKRATVFSDVSDRFFASGFIQTAVEIGLISGYPDGTFKPNNPVSREEAAVLLNRAFTLSHTSTLLFPDVDPGHYSFSSIQKVVGEQIAYGYPDGLFRPKQGVTRAEVSTFLHRALTK